MAPSLTLLGLALYIVGYLYDAAYLEQFGIDSSFFPRTSPEYFMMAFVGFFLLSFAALKVFISYTFLVVAVIFIPIFASYYVDTLLEKWSDKLAIKLRGSINKERGLASIAKGEAILYVFSVLLFASIGLMLSGYLGFSSGQEHAKSGIAKFQVCDQATQKTQGCAFLLGGTKVIVSGLLVSRSSTHMALYAEGKTAVLPLKEYSVAAFKK